MVSFEERCQSAPVEALYHVIPLHYLPSLCQTREILSQAELRRRGIPIAPRRTAAKRDRKLHLDDSVHLSPLPRTPLLRQKLALGYPHARVRFYASVLEMPGTGLVRYNPKSWRHRESFLPVTETAEKNVVWQEWRLGRYPSLEVVVPVALPLTPYAESIAFGQRWEIDWLEELCSALAIVVRLPVVHDEALRCADYDRTPYIGYRVECQTAGKLLAPPVLPFD